jgi:hypothetical protein
VAQIECGLSKLGQPTPDVPFLLRPPLQYSVNPYPLGYLLTHGTPFLRLRRGGDDPTRERERSRSVFVFYHLGPSVLWSVHAVRVSVSVPPNIFVLRCLTIVLIHNPLCRIGSSTFKAAYSSPCSSVPNTTLESTTFRYTRLAGQPCSSHGARHSV